MGGILASRAWVSSVKFWRGVNNKTGGEIEWPWGWALGIPECIRTLVAGPAGGIRRRDHWRTPLENEGLGAKDLELRIPEEEFPVSHSVELIVVAPAGSKPAGS